MKTFLLLLALILPCTAGAAECTGTDLLQVEGAVADARVIAAAAEKAVPTSAAGVDARYTLWFGPYDPTITANVKSVMSSVIGNLTIGTKTYRCLDQMQGDCSLGYDLFVVPENPNVVSFCPGLFSLGNMRHQASGIVHEFVHLSLQNPRTNPHPCDNPVSCKALAGKSDVWRSPYSYEYWVRDY